MEFEDAWPQRLERGLSRHRGETWEVVSLARPGMNTAEEAEQGFMSSPGHRANIVDPRPRRVGIGIVFGAAVTGTTPLFVTQLFSN